jgi:hypothetical protein
MSKWYRRMQLISTAVMLFPSAVLLLFGYLSATSPRHSALEAVILFVLAVALPPLVSGGWALVISLKRAQQPGADPSSLAARLGKKPYLGFHPRRVDARSAGGSQPFQPKPRSERREGGFLRDMRTSCLSGATSAVKREGLDPSTSAAKARIDTRSSPRAVERAWRRIRNSSPSSTSASSKRAGVSRSSNQTGPPEFAFATGREGGEFRHRQEALHGRAPVATSGAGQRRRATR